MSSRVLETALQERQISNRVARQSVVDDGDDAEKTVSVLRRGSNKQANNQRELTLTLASSSQLRWALSVRRRIFD